MPRCDDGTLSPNSPLVEWSNLLFDATARAYKPMAYNTDTRVMLERTGFVEISEQVIQVPLNPWPADPYAKEIGSWYNLGLTQGLEALTIAPLTRMLSWTKPDVDRLIADVRKEICSRKVHSYCNM